jgi:benzil reductase ((S)-benzoin forming)
MINGRAFMTIIVTGATGGLGRCIVHEIHGKSQDKLVCCYRNKNKFTDLFSEIGKDVSKYLTYKDDDFNGLLEMKEVSESGFIVLILNAFSITPLKSVGDYTQSEIDGMIDGNIKSNVRLLNRIVKHSKEQNKKLRIINLDSGAAYFPLKGWGNYCASKAYMDALLGVVALENPNFEIVSFDPGVMDTDMQRQIRECSDKVFDKVDEFRSYKENGKLRQPESVASQIAKRYIYDWKAKELREKII